MIKPAHSPGPWCIVNDTICIGPVGCQLPIAKEVKLHNARLMVCAPELLEVLYLIHTELRLNVKPSLALMDMAMNVLKKAKGEISDR